MRFDEIGTEVAHDMTRTLSIRGDDPNSARSLIEQSYRMGREGWRIAIETRTEMTSTPETYRLTGHVAASENGVVVLERRFDEEIPRDPGD